MFSKVNTKVLRKIKKEAKEYNKKEKERLSKIRDFDVDEIVILSRGNISFRGVVKRVNNKTYSIEFFLTNNKNDLVLIDKETLTGIPNSIKKSITGDGRRFVGEDLKLSKIGEIDYIDGKPYYTEYYYDEYCLLISNNSMIYYSSYDDEKQINKFIKITGDKLFLKYLNGNENLLEYMKNNKTVFQTGYTKNTFIEEIDDIEKIDDIPTYEAFISKIK
jgi:hypothetical protein